MGSSIERKLRVGDVQCKRFTANDRPTIVALDTPKYDVTITGPPKTSDKTLIELKEALIAMELPQLAVSTAAKIKENAVRVGLKLQKTFSPFTEGYVEKAKGLKQIAWERGCFQLRNYELKVR